MSTTARNCHSSKILNHNSQWQETRRHGRQVAKFSLPRIVQNWLKC